VYSIAATHKQSLSKNQNLEPMAKKRTDKDLQVNRFLLRKLCGSRRALAIPVTFLILFVTMLGMISVTYYFAVDKVNTRSTALKIATAKQDMLSFSETVLPILWQPGSACVFEFSDTGGKLNVQPSTNPLVINVSDNQEISENIFSAAVGQVTYELSYSQTADTGT
jgi:hypothetical protein